MVALDARELDATTSVTLLARSLFSAHTLALDLGRRGGLCDALALTCGPRIFAH
jgi:hypothetical protein